MFFGFFRTCSGLQGMGSSLSDPTVWNEDNRMVIENVFEQLETLAIDAEHLSLRIRCLILGCDLNHFCLMEDHG